LIRRELRSAFLFGLPLAISLAAAVVTFARARGGFAPDGGVEARVYQQADLVARVLSHLDRDYVERFDDKKSWDLVYSSLKAMTKELDPYSTFLTPDESRPFAEETHKNYVGVGFATNPEAPPITIDYLFDGSPAEKAGLVPGDRVVAVEGKSIASLSREQAIETIKGRPGTKVKLTILRAATQKEEEFDLERARIDQPSVFDAHLVDESNHVGYVHVDGFGDSTVEEFDVAMKELQKLGATSLVLDLRFNNGGLLDVSRRFANRFVKDGAIVSIHYREPKQDVTYHADPAECRHADLPLVVLVNGDSASAAEIVAGALQDHERALLVGERTYGKGVVQSIWKMPLDRAAADDADKPTVTLKLTTAEYLTPAGRVIEKQVTRQQKVLGGLEPDVKVKLDEARTKELITRMRLLQVPDRWRAQHLAAHRRTMPPLADRQLDAALAVLRGETPAQDF
jgi:carboxyl-terminal processing protease